MRRYFDDVIHRSFYVNSIRLSLLDEYGHTLSLGIEGIFLHTLCSVPERYTIDTDRVSELEECYLCRVTRFYPMIECRIGGEDEGFREQLEFFAWSCIFLSDTE